MEDNNRYGLPEGMPRDKYGHAVGANTDPYGILSYVVGNGDDIICFDYDYFHWQGVEYCALHAVINSDTGGFIKDFDYAVFELVDKCAIINPEILRVAAGMVERAMEWCLDNEVKHDRSGWNQDEHYFVRTLAVDTQLQANLDPAVEAAELSKDTHALRYGGYHIDRMVNMVADQEIFSEVA